MHSGVRTVHGAVHTCGIIHHSLFRNRPQESCVTTTNTTIHSCVCLFPSITIMFYCIRFYWFGCRSSDLRGHETCPEVRAEWCRATEPNRNPADETKKRLSVQPKSSK
mmetsp:Transcript_8411/g.20790  ORF Transcript_8411/g.20790 Transcript_8411/m.20790 type:complete len:108 (+) Transcript_8411:1203-1526(+)